MRAFSVRGLTEGAVLAAIVAVLALATRYLPVAGAVAGFLAPVPLTLTVIRHGLRPALLAALVAAFIAGMVAGPFVGATILIMLAPAALVVGLGVRRGRSAPEILLYSAVAATLSLAAFIGLSLALSGVNPYALLIDSMRASQETVGQMARWLGMTPEQYEQSAAPMRQALEQAPRLIPFFIVLGGLTNAYINFVVTRAVLRRVGHTMPAAPPMTAWRIPTMLLWLLPLGVVLVGTGRDRSAFVEMAGLNLTVIAQTLFTFQGLLVGWVLLDRYGVPVALRVLSYALLLYNPIFGIVAFVLGLADSAFYLRRRWAPKPMEP